MFKIADSEVVQGELDVDKAKEILDGEAHGETYDNQQTNYYTTTDTIRASLQSGMHIDAIRAWISTTDPPSYFTYSPGQADIYKQRSPSSSKRYRKKTDLLRLDHPIKFAKEDELREALPADAHDLYDALALAEFCVSVIPTALKNTPGTRLPLQRASLLSRNTSRLLDITKRSKESSDRRRSEAAWNSHVHYQVLHQLAETPSVSVEDITSARIVPRFRPCITTVDQLADDDASLSSTGSCSTNTTLASRANASESVHKMVDFALALEPDPDLAAAIERGTINQTAYFPLKSRPAPVGIETKTSAGNSETAGVQLGVWIAAWHEGIRSLMKRGGLVERIITVPLIQVFEGSWTLMFAVDAGHEIPILVSISFIET
ncbi:hypothetical protein FZEAL_10124 [Fusarium zealandicum]|uniref:PD-(D/E)XK nuclease-like domain-containing protein n=1 Tax=Fusarium zealandicum TaxID=1053134 RepID=A0A8H4XD65_9HYPO|nr:hypothetical protein FZEAL_10124 [Fusarium zealandicum]